MTIDWIDVSILIVFGFLAAFIDSVVGGGGLISIPALIATGLPPTTVLGTNKLASSFGALMSAINFLRAKQVDFKYVMKLFPFACIASPIGVLVAYQLPADILKPLMLIVLSVVAIYTLFKKDFEQTKVKPNRMMVYILTVILIFIAFYDGLFGGGTGTFLIFTLLMLGQSFLRAAGNAKVLNFASNISALVFFIILGEVNFIYGLIMAASMVVGSYVGSRLAILKGSSYVRILFIIVTFSLIIKGAYDYFIV
ncbi:sulfite exporter TauE/SafE family protein [Abyssicoccus albus]|uniref:sulfite exporter TauE/SafE family protein n=1 Tax=Abyssicoccus albus TaxID=1817405 RepID=UPI00097E309F|nr:TSUP family transporter [Abyssicoccus albus]AQL56490.1 hypothetical protein BVH56_05940 [Abyssicoccus albus]